jgi:hypothetical protein
MNTKVIMQGQTEVGIVSNGVNECSALGSSVNGEDITGYAHGEYGGWILKRWNGALMLRRGTEVKTYRAHWETGERGRAIVFRLPNKRFIVGYALDDEMLFRGRLLSVRKCNELSEDELMKEALSESEYWRGIDDEEREHGEQIKIDE